MTQQMIDTLSIEKSPDELRQWAYTNWNSYPVDYINGYLIAAEQAECNQTKVER